jgi:hypothetical protein
MLQIPIDHNIAQSGIYFGYKDSIYMCNLEGIPLPTKDHLIQAYKEEEIRERIVRLKTSKQVDKAWDDRYELFESAYNAPIGSGSVSLYATMHTALEMGFPKDYVKELVEDINSSWEIPMKSSRLKQTLIVPILGEEFE